MIMNSTRSRVAIGAALLTATFFVFSVASAQGLSNRMRAKVPFDFTVGEHQLPAGDYEMQTVASGVVKLYNPETHDVMIFNAIRLGNPIRDSAKGKLVFHKYGDDYFLSEMWWTGTTDGLQPIQSKRERELARVSTPVRVSIVQ
jgi:hypothetical protein